MTKTLKVQVLITARALIAEKKNWTQMAYARDEDGDEVCPIDHEAVRFCAIGAIVRAYRICTGHYDHDWELRGIPGKTLDRLEDISEEKGHAAVLKAFDKLISEA